MRMLMGFGIAVLALLFSTGSALADKAKDPDAIDIKPVRDKLVVLTDGAGHYMVIEPKVASDHIYYSSDGRDFYAQRVFTGGTDSSRGYFSKGFWAPRAGVKAQAEITRQAKTKPKPKTKPDPKDLQWSITCGKQKTIMVVLPGAEAGRILDNAVFHKTLWRHKAYALSRDDRGTYYYVDHLRKEYGSKGFRLWVGQRGSMVRQKMTNIVSDSEGDIFATKKGDLRMILSKKEATWVKGKRRTSLTHVPVWKNVYMIYTELGVYVDPLGTPCDDL